jgi:hypothetical protein
MNGSFYNPEAISSGICGGEIQSAYCSTEAVRGGFQEVFGTGIEVKMMGSLVKQTPMQRSR